MLVPLSDTARDRVDSRPSRGASRASSATLVCAGCCAGCGPSYATVGGAALITALPAALFTMAMLSVLELLWGPALHGSAGLRRRWLFAAIGAIAMIVGLVLDRLVLPRSVREAPFPLACLGLLVTNTLAVALALIGWRLVARSSAGARRDLTAASILAAYWLLAAIAVLVGRGRMVHEVIGTIVLWGGLLGGVPGMGFTVFAVEGSVRRNAREERDEHE